MELRKRNNNHDEEPKREKLQKLEKELKKLETPIETRINVNLCLLVYWLPGRFSQNIVGFLFLDFLEKQSNKQAISELNFI